MSNRAIQGQRLKMTESVGLSGGGRVQHDHQGHSGHQLRLVITVPAMLILMALGYGLVSFLAFDRHWNELDSLGAGSVAGRLLWTHLVTMLVLTGVALVLGVAMAFSILKPIRAITEASRLAGEGKLNHAETLPASTELVDLSKSFNSMIDNLNDSIVKRNRGLLEGLPVGMMIVDMHGTISAVTPVASEMLRYPADQIVGQPIDQLYSRIRAERPGLVARMESLWERMMTSSSGMVELDSMPEEAEGNGLIVSISGLGGPKQRMIGLVFTLREASPVCDLNSHFERTDQLAALGTFTLGLADELRNPLGSIKGLSQMLMLNRGKHPKVESYLDRMVDEVDRVDALMQQLLELGEQPHAVVEETNLSELVNHAIDVVGREPDVQVEDMERLVVSIDPVPPVRLDGERLVPAIVQIIDNARVFSPSGSPIRIHLCAVQHTHRNHAEISIQNAGSEIPSEIRDRVFEPFFTTRQDAKGLGLTIADQVISQNGGTLDLEFADGSVCFRIRFPLERGVQPIISSTGGAVA